VAIQVRDLDTDPDTGPYRDTGKTCLGGDMHCPLILVTTVINYISAVTVTHFYYQFDNIQRLGFPFSLRT